MKQNETKYSIIRQSYMQGTGVPLQKIQIYFYEVSVPLRSLGKLTSSLIHRREEEEEVVNSTN